MDPKTQEELRAEFRRLFDADMLDEAEKILEQLEPLSDEQWLKQLHEAPLDDEPLTPRELEAIERAHLRAERRARQAG